MNQSLKAIFSFGLLGLCITSSAQTQDSVCLLAAKIAALQAQELELGKSESDLVADLQALHDKRALEITDPIFREHETRRLEAHKRVVAYLISGATPAKTARKAVYLKCKAGDFSFP